VFAGIKELSKLSRKNFSLGGLRKEVPRAKNERFHLGYFSYCIKKKIEVEIQRTSRVEREVMTSQIMLNKKVYRHS